MKGEEERLRIPRCFDPRKVALRILHRKEDARFAIPVATTITLHRCSPPRGAASVSADRGRDPRETSADRTDSSANDMRTCVRVSLARSLARACKGQSCECEGDTVRSLLRLTCPLIELACSWVPVLFKPLPSCAAWKDSVQVQRMHAREDRVDTDKIVDRTRHLM